MKKFLILILILIFYSTNIYSQVIGRSGLVKVVTTFTDGNSGELKEYGTGNIIGFDSEYLYMLTASHVAFPLNEDQEIIDSKPVIKIIVREDILATNISPKYFSLLAEVIEKDIYQDILVARIPVAGLSINPGISKGYGFESFTKGPDTLSGCVNHYSNMFLSGFPGAAAQEQERIGGIMYTRTLADDNRYFVMSNIPLEVGYSGSLVKWMDDQVVGMVLSKMDEDKAKVIRLETIFKFLNLNSIKSNLLKNHDLIGRWQCDSIVISAGNSAHVIKSDKMMIFKNNGSVEGIGNGTFCFVPNGIRLNTSNNIEYTLPGNGFTTLYLLSNEDFRVEDPSNPYMYNFSEQTPTRRRLVISSLAIYLTKLE